MKIADGDVIRYFLKHKNYKWKILLQMKRKNIL